ncbi:MAG: MASE1 domain-containing protein, partial [Methylococcales bacterium]|nr:MASE1 domain-containing protein [Methylococcales bacterium]
MVKCRPIRYISLIGLVAGSYFVFGLLGLLLKVPPSNAGGLWPPAGISLAAMLLLGPRIWPGVFIGNFCISAYAFGFTETSLPIYAATGFGATCCALVGTSLIKRFVGFPTPLTDDRSILLFMLLGGPLSCLIPASTGIAAMVLANIVTAPEITVNWVSWWVGDTIGVLVFTPLMLAAFAQPKTIWTKRRISVGIPLLISFTLVVIFFFYVRKAEQEQHHQQLLDQSITLSQALKNRIAGDFRAINAITNFFIGSHSVEAKEFSLFSVRTLSPFKEIKAIRWFPINNAKAFTTLLNKQTEAPSAIPQHVLDRIYGTQETEYLSYENEIINFSTPVFSHADNTLLGYIVTSITIKELVQQALEELNNHGCFLTISAKTPSSSNSSTLIYSSNHTLSIAPYQQYLLQVANQQWQVSFYHDLVMENSRIHWSIWWVLISGLLFTSSLGIGLLMLTGRYFQTELIVDERTADLLQAKNAAEAANKAKSQFLA